MTFVSVEHDFPPPENHETSNVQRLAFAFVFVQFAFVFLPSFLQDCLCFVAMTCLCFGALAFVSSAFVFQTDAF